MHTKLWTQKSLEIKHQCFLCIQGITCLEVTIYSSYYSYSCHSKTFIDATKKPGPGAHCPEKVSITKKAAPAHSMGIRHSEYICPLIIDVSD